MSGTELLAPPAPSVNDSDAIPPWPIYRLSVEQYDQMVASGALTEDDPLELLEGYLVPKMPKSPLQDCMIKLFDQVISRLIGTQWHVRGQSVLITTHSEPEPDLAIVRGQAEDYRNRHPSGADAGLIVEIADTTLRRDRKKAAIYAAAGVPEYWIVNLSDWQLERMSGPRSDGTFAETSILIAVHTVPLVLDGSVVGEIPLKDLLNPNT